MSRRVSLVGEVGWASADLGALLPIMLGRPAPLRSADRARAALLGVVLLVLGLGFAADAAALLGGVPTGAPGALLLVAGGDLALSGRRLEARADCRPAIAAAAPGTLLLGPSVGLVAGRLVEGARRQLRPLLRSTGKI